MSIILGDALVDQRAKLVIAVHATWREELWKGSDAWRAHQAAVRALDQFDLDHPQIVMELYAKFEEIMMGAKVK